MPLGFKRNEVTVGKLRRMSVKKMSITDFLLLIIVFAVIAFFGVFLVWRFVWLPNAPPGEDASFSTFLGPGCGKKIVECGKLLLGW